MTDIQFYTVGDFVFLNGHGIKKDDIVSLKPDASGNTNVRTRDGVIALFSGVTPEEVAQVIDADTNPSEIPAPEAFRKALDLLDYEVHEKARKKYERKGACGCLFYLLKDDLFNFWEAVEYMQKHFKGLDE